MVRRGPKTSVLCAQSEELHQKRACLESDARYGVGKFERGGGGFVFLEGGFVKRGVRTNPPNPSEPPEPPLVTGLSPILGDVSGRTRKLPTRSKCHHRGKVIQGSGSDTHTTGATSFS